MAQTYLKKIDIASRSETSNSKKIRLIILIFTVAGSLFGLSEYKSGTTIDYIDDMRVEKPYVDFNGYFGIFLLFMAAFFGIFAVFGIFKDMVNKQSADVQLSLPMSAQDRYLSKLLALFKIHLLPLMISAVFMIVAGGAKTGYFGGTGNLLRWYVAIIAFGVFLDAISIFCMCCCGAKAEGVYTTLITAGCLTFTPYAFYEMSVLRFSGISTGEFEAEKIFSLFGLMSVIWVPEGVEPEYAAEPWIYLLVNILLSLLVVFASFFIYKKRDAKYVGNPMAFPLFMELFLFLGLFTLFTLFFYGGIWLIGIVLAGVIYLVIRIVAARAKINAKSFGSWIAKYGINLAVFLVIMGISYFTGGYGLYRHMPKVDAEDNYANIEIDVTQYTGSSESYDSYYLYYGGGEYRNERFKDQPKGYEQSKIYVDNAADLIRTYYTLNDRSLAKFFDIMFSGHYYYRNRDYKATNIEIVVSTGHEGVVTSNYNRYTVNFTIPKADYEKFVQDCILHGFTKSDDNYYYDYDYYY